MTLFYGMTLSESQVEVRRLCQVGRVCESMTGSVGLTEKSDRTVRVRGDSGAWFPSPELCYPAFTLFTTLAENRLCGGAEHNLKEEHNLRGCTKIVALVRCTKRCTKFV
eukprot:8018746-Pyramimonas_sp.AAC.2